MISFIILFETSLNFYQHICIFPKFLFELFFVCSFLLIGNSVFHARPEIHGHGTKLYLHRKIFHSVQTVHRNSHDHMITAVSIRLRISDIVPFLDHNQVALAFQKFCEIVNIIHKIADHPDTCNILQIIFCIDHSFFFAFSLQFFFDTALLLDPALNVVDRSGGRFPIQIMVQHIQTGQKHLLGIFIWLYKFIVFFISHFSFLL